jgi:HK97 family phage portal protein
MSLFAKRAITPDAIKTSNWIPGPNWSGETISESSALEVSAVLSCVSLLADSVATLPIRAVNVIGDRTERQPTPSWLNASSSVTRYELMHMIVSCLALHGNAYIYVDREGGIGIPIALQPLHPNDVQVNIVNRHRAYTTGGTTIPSENMLHIRWWTPPQSARGLSPIEMQKTTIGLALAQERHLAQWYSEGGVPASVLEVDGDMSAEQAKTLQATWESQNRRRRRPAVLTGGMKWKSITESAADMEMNAARELQIAQVARIFRIPPNMIGARGDSATYSNVESAGLNFVTYTLLPWLTRIESALSSLMPAPQEMKFDTSAFLRADTISRYRAHQVGIMSGFLTPNESRAVEGLEPYDGGDEFVMALPGAPMAGPGITLPPMGIDEQPPE